jgi:hypothetical protein
LASDKFASLVDLELGAKKKMIGNNKANNRQKIATGELTEEEKFQYLNRSRSSGVGTVVDMLKFISSYASQQQQSSSSLSKK